MTTTPEMIEQVEQERKELDNAPKIPLEAFQPRAGHGESGRCGWCGQWADDLVAVHDYGAPPQGGGTPTVINAERYKGVKCCGGRHV